MVGHPKRATLVTCVALAVAASGFTLKNGGEFFQPAGAGKVDLVYFGFIKDTKGKLITDAAIIKVDARNLDMDFRFMNDKPGHYRSPDIGAYHKEMGVPVNPAELEITAQVPGYKQVSPIKTTVPNKIKGAINIDFVMEKM